MGHDQSEAKLTIKIENSLFIANPLPVTVTREGLNIAACGLCGIERGFSWPFGAAVIACCPWVSFNRDFMPLISPVEFGKCAGSLGSSAECSSAPALGSLRKARYNALRQ
jgi:hypothetical protein